MAGRSDVKVITISDEVAADDDFIVTAARPNTTATLANASFASGGARQLAVSTTGTSDNGKTTTITGTNTHGDTISEVITSTGSAEAVNGSKYFKTITAVECSAQYAANIKVGSQATAAQAVFAGRVRLKGYSISSGSTAGTISFYNGTPESGSSVFTARTIGTDNTNIAYNIPDEGVLFEDGMTVLYTVDTITQMTFFYA